MAVTDVTNELMPDRSVKDPKVGPAKGHSFDWADQLGMGITPRGEVYTVRQEYTSRDLQEMLKRDARARSLSNALALPIMGTTWSINPAKGDTGQAAWLSQWWQTEPNQGGCSQSLPLLIAQACTAFVHGRAFWEFEWKVQDGKFVFGSVQFRPQTTVDVLRDPKSGRVAAIQQFPLNLGVTDTIRASRKLDNGYIRMEARNVWAYIHGIDRDPVNGMSDLDVVYACFQTAQKIRFLYFRFLERVSLPFRTVTTTDRTDAQQMATALANAPASGVLGLGTGDMIGTVDAAGQGGAQFLEAIKYLEGAAATSLLAGFVDMPTNSTRGSFAMSSDQSDFFLKSEQARAKQMADSIRWGLLAPMIYANYGPDTSVPLFEFGSLSDRDQGPTLQLMELYASNPSATLPGAFWDELILDAARFLDMDVDKITPGVVKARGEAEKVAAASQAASIAGSKMAAKGFGPGGAPLGSTPPKLAGDIAGIDHVAGLVRKATPQKAAKATAPGAIPRPDRKPGPKPPKA